MTWTVEVEADTDSSPPAMEVPEHNLRRTFSDEQDALRHAKGCAIHGWFVTITEPNGQQAIL